MNRDRLSVLISLITVFPPEDADHKRGHKHPFIASELFSCECWSILDTFFSDQHLLTQLFDFLRSDEINSTLAGYFSKLVLTLLGRKPFELFSFICTSSIFFSIAKNLYSKSISDIAIKLLTIDNQSSDPNFFIEVRERLLIEVVKQLHSENELSHYFVGVVVSEFIAKGAEINS